MNRWLPVAGMVCAALFLSRPVKADIDVVKDAAGDRRFTENCPQRRCEPFLKTRISGASTPKLSRYRSKTRPPPELMTTTATIPKHCWGTPIKIFQADSADQSKAGQSPGRWSGVRQAPPA